MFKGDADEVDHGAGAELVFDDGAGIGDGLVGNVDVAGDFGGALAAAQQPDDFQFAGVELGKRIVGGLQVVERQLLGDFGVQEHAAVGHLDDGFDEIVGIVVFGEVALGAAFDGPGGEDRIVVHAEQDDPGLRVFDQDAPGDLESGRPGSLMSMTAASGWCSA